MVGDSMSGDPTGLNARALIPDRSASHLFLFIGAVTEDRMHLCG